MGLESNLLREQFAARPTVLKLLGLESPPEISAGGKFSIPEIEALFAVWLDGASMGTTTTPASSYIYRTDIDQMEPIVLGRLKVREEVRLRKKISLTEEEEDYDRTCYLRGQGLL